MGIEEKNYFLEAGFKIFGVLLKSNHTALNEPKNK